MHSQSGPPRSPSTARGPRPRKRFGQHFLVDGNIIRKILNAAGPTEGDRVLEIGPGRGALTEPLVASGCRVTAIEVDRDLAAMLRERFSDADGFELVEADALKVSYSALADEEGGRFKVVANLPYNISGPMTARLIEERAAFTRLVLSYQKEVAERLVAVPGTKDYGVLSVLAQMYLDVRAEFPVSPASFSPPPAVDSMVVSMVVRSEPRFPVGDYGVLKRVVRAAFGQRRKTLSNALKALGMGPDATARALGEAGIDPKRRGETLSLREFAALANIVGSITSGN